MKKHSKIMHSPVGAYTRNAEHMKPIHPEYAAHILNEVAAKDAVFTADTGMCNVWTARYIDPLGSRRLIGSLLHGSMANALPMAIGAQVAYPNRQVVSVSGDGGLAMLLGELVTARMHDLPIKVVVFNNWSMACPTSALMSTTSTTLMLLLRSASTASASRSRRVCARLSRKPSLLTARP